MPTEGHLGLPDDFLDKSGMGKRGKVDSVKGTSEVFNSTCSNCSSKVEAGQKSCNDCGYTLVFPEGK